MLLCLFIVIHFKASLTSKEKQNPEGKHLPTWNIRQNAPLQGSSKSLLFSKECLQQNNEANIQSEA